MTVAPELCVPLSGHWETCAEHASSVHLSLDPTAMVYVFVPSVAHLSGAQHSHVQS